MALSIIYRDVAPGAAEQAQVTTTTPQLLQSFSTLSDLTDDKPIPSVATLEQDFWQLGSDLTLFPDTPEDGRKWGVWSSALSDSYGRFSSPLVLRLSLPESTSSVGISLTFDTAGGVWWSDVAVTWYRGGETIAQGRYYPNGVTYTCAKAVTDFDAVQIICYGISEPYHYAKLASVQFGVTRVLTADDYYSVSVTQKISPISDTIEINTLEASIRGDASVPYLFQSQQRITVLDGPRLIGHFYLDEATRTGADTYRIVCDDALSLLPTYHNGGMYNGTALDTVLADIIGGSLAYTLDTALTDQKVYGYLPRDSALNNLARVAFAAGAIVDTSGGDGIRVFAEAEGGISRSYNRDNTYSGGNVSMSKAVTQLVVTSHKYTLSADVITLYTDDLPAKTTTTVYMTDPCGGYAAKSPILLFETGPNVIKVQNYGLNTTKATVTGSRYADATIDYVCDNPDVGAGAAPNIVTVADVTTITDDNAQAVAARLLRHYRRSAAVEAKVLYDGVRPGDRVQIVDVFGVTRKGIVTAVDIAGGNSTTAASITVLCDKEE